MKCPTFWRAVVPGADWWRPGRPTSGRAEGSPVHAVSGCCLAMTMPSGGPGDQSMPWPSAEAAARPGAAGCGSGRPPRREPAYTSLPGRRSRHICSRSRRLGAVTTPPVGCAACLPADCRGRAADVRGGATSDAERRVGAGVRVRARRRCTVLPLRI